MACIYELNDAYVTGCLDKTREADAYLDTS